ncbi:hypothetical protein AB0D27_39490 [Streptomyces sp. NPDC048415]|jgi:hypothetical protein|uniref:hypothetical protein n=1 Tax=Streptomyces sp. NPDC048415 TaxID=3154822 RepID=UPI003433FBEA
MVSSSWSLHGDESAIGRPPFVEPAGRVADDFVLSAAELLETALGLTLTRILPSIATKGE